MSFVSRLLLRSFISKQDFDYARLLRESDGFLRVAKWKRARNELRRIDLARAEQRNRLREWPAA